MTTTPDPYLVQEEDDEASVNLSEADDDALVPLVGSEYLVQEGI